MKKLSILLILITFCLSTKNVSAQDLLIRAGLSTSGSSSFKYKNMTENSNFNINPGIHFGMIMESPLRKMLSLETGFLVNNQSTELVVTNTRNGTTSSYKNSLVSIMVPLATKVSVDAGNVKIYGSLGGYLGTFIRNGFLLPVFEGDYGLTFGTGIEKGNIQFGINYSFGIPKIPLTENKEQIIRNRILSFFATYRLSAKSNH